MSKNNLVKTSKFLSLVLRHKPEEIGITLDQNGWVSVSELLDACNKHDVAITLEELETVVATSDKKRFAFNENRSLIRANQGHSVEVDLGFQPQEPPEILYHGTAERFISSIMEIGLVKGNRHHVHLSKDIETAIKVGQRHGKPIVLIIKSRLMHSKGYDFFISDNGVWLTDHVPKVYLDEFDAGRESRA
jgi:RNA:NAD 2''-phosphotransferase